MADPNAPTQKLAVPEFEGVTPGSVDQGLEPAPEFLPDHNFTGQSGGTAEHQAAVLLKDDELDPTADKPTDPNNVDARGDRVATSNDDETVISSPNQLGKTEKRTRALGGKVLKFASAKSKIVRNKKIQLETRKLQKKESQKNEQYLALIESLDKEEAKDFYEAQRGFFDEAIAERSEELEKMSSSERALARLEIKREAFLRAYSDYVVDSRNDMLDSLPSEQKAVFEDIEAQNIDKAMDAQGEEIDKMDEKARLITLLKLARISSVDAFRSALAHQHAGDKDSIGLLWAEHDSAVNEMIQEYGGNFSEMSKDVKQLRLTEIDAAALRKAQNVLNEHTKPTADNAHGGEVEAEPVAKTPLALRLHDTLSAEEGELERILFRVDERFEEEKDSLRMMSDADASERKLGIFDEARIDSYVLVTTKSRNRMIRSLEFYDNGKLKQSFLDNEKKAYDTIMDKAKERLPNLSTIDRRALDMANRRKSTIIAFANTLNDHYEHDAPENNFQQLFLKKRHEIIGREVRSLANMDDETRDQRMLEITAEATMAAHEETKDFLKEKAEAEKQQTPSQTSSVKFSRRPRKARKHPNQARLDSDRVDVSSTEASRDDAQQQTIIPQRRQARTTTANTRAKSVTKEQIEDLKSNIDLDEGADSGFNQGEQLKVLNASGNTENNWIFLGVDKNTGLAKVGSFDEFGRRVYKNYTFGALRRLNPKSSTHTRESVPSLQISRRSRHTINK